VNARIYSLLLRLYPAELRHNFGAEMTQVFLDDINESGAARAWSRSLKELWQIALLTPRVMVPVFIYLFQALYFYGVMRSHRGFPVLLIPVLTTFIALEARGYDVPDPSSLTRR
jgi:hypothetical protein